MTQPHVLVANVFFAPMTYGGATVVAEEVAKRLVARHGARVSAVSAMSRPELPAYGVVRTERDGIVNHVINLPPGRGYVEAYRNPRVAEVFGALLRQLAPDLVHVHCVQDLGAEVLSEASALGLPSILSVHDFWWICERQFMIRPDGRYCGQAPVTPAGCRGCVDDAGLATQRRDWLSRTAEAVDLVTYPSRFALDLSEGSGFARGRGVVWQNGVRPPGPDFAARQAARRAADPRVTFGFVGGPSVIKGWTLLREALTGLEPRDLRGLLVDASRDGSWWHDRRLDGLTGDWRVVPRFDQATMDDFWAEVDVLLFPSQWKETFGLTIREALSRGIRVIQTDSGGTMEHDGGRLTQVLPMGAGAAALRGAIRTELDRPRGGAPVAVPTQDDQAAAFLDLARPFLPTPALERVHRIA